MDISFLLAVASLLTLGVACLACLGVDRVAKKDRRCVNDYNSLRQPVLKKQSIVHMLQPLGTALLGLTGLPLLANEDKTYDDVTERTWRDSESDDDDYSDDSFEDESTESEVNESIEASTDFALSGDFSAPSKHLQTPLTVVDGLQFYSTVAFVSASAVQSSISRAVRRVSATTELCEAQMIENQAFSSVVEKRYPDISCLPANKHRRKDLMGVLQAPRPPLSPSSQAA